MAVPVEAQSELLSILSSFGSRGSIITEIETKSKYERHTISKYLMYMESSGLVHHKAIGKAKIWYINHAPVQTIMHALPEKKSFTENLLCSIIDNLPNGFVIIDDQYKILFMNGLMVATYGNRESSFFYETILGKKNPLSIKKISEVMEKRKDSVKVQVKDILGGTVVIRASRIQNPDQTSAVLLMIADITDQVAAQEEIIKQKNLLQAERDALNKAVIVTETDTQGKIVYVNDMFSKISGYSKEELLGKTHQVVNSGYHPPSFFKEMWATLEQGKIWQGKIKNKSKSGKEYWVESVLTPVLNEKKKPTKYLALRFPIDK